MKPIEILKKMGAVDEKMHFLPTAECDSASGRPQHPRVIDMTVVNKCLNAVVIYNISFL